MRKVLIAFVSLCICYFIAGYIGVRYGRLSESTFITYATILGGLASVSGLLSLIRPSITKTDIQELEVDALKKISRAAEDLERFQSERTQSEQELAKLAQRKEEMKFLIKKASLSLFLRDQLATVQRQIAEILEQNKELTLLIEKYDQVKEKLYALEEEIEHDKNSEILYDIMKSAVEIRRIEEDRSRRNQDLNDLDLYSLLGVIRRFLR